MPLPGIFASSFKNIGPQGAYDSLAVTTVGSTPVGTVTFSGIPQNYKHLQVRILMRSDRATTLDSNFIYFNGDTTTSNYVTHGLVGSGSGTPGAYTDTADYIGIGVLPGSSIASNIFGVSIVDILDYTNINKYKVCKTLNGTDANGSGQARFNSGMWMNTGAVTSISFNTHGGGNFTQYSQFAIYGVK